MAIIKCKMCGGALRECETEPAECLDTLRQAVVDGDAVLALCRKAGRSLAEHCRLCKLYKKHCRKQQNRRTLAHNEGVLRFLLPYG